MLNEPLAVSEDLGWDLVLLFYCSVLIWVSGVELHCGIEDRCSDEMQGETLSPFPM